MLEHAEEAAAILNAAVFGEQIAELRDADPDEIAKFSLDGLVQPARVVDVYDGDTVTVLLHTHGELCKWSVRLHGIDTCEIRGRKRTAVQRRLAEAAKRFVVRHTRGRRNLITLECLEFGKFGRPLGRLWVRDAAGHMICLNDALLEHGLAVPYFGGSKKKAHSAVSQSQSRSVDTVAGETEYAENENENKENKEEETNSSDRLLHKSGSMDLIRASCNSL